ncbi:hypothetical protein SERLA73DRAFT_62902 [Serpula lacrymans var. lacrymans S7.3]|uniref:Fungal pheromone STE3G-protein-coupled receptor n=1 Tax=Serpula lacrymans var. lacrymans (strain S7.3) TaxID=936435 RepID=F8QBY7_SERL3|nr:hypothetical protein SERLA73DRAFT_62902 [Serpula lacrymans var. lacrymans S7.3]
MGTRNHIFSVFSFIGFALVSILLPFHLRAKSIGTCAFIVWTGLLCLNGFVNSVVWNDNVVNWAPVWCDISSRLAIGGRVAIPATSLCITCRLHSLLRLRPRVNSTRRRKNKKRFIFWMDLFIVLGIPVLSMVLAYVIQYQRFIIFEELGCHYSLYNTIPAFPLYGIWPVVIGLITAVYAGLIFRAIIQRKMRLNEFMQRDWRIGSHQCWRLTGVVIAVFICSFPTSLWYLVEDILLGPAQPWPGWKVVHASNSEIAQFTNEMWQFGNSVALYEWERWCYVVYAIIFFTLFGFTTEAKKNYRLAFRFVFRRCTKVPEPDIFTKKFVHSPEVM